MQTLSWYVQRMRAMSTREVAWRVRAAAQDRVDHLRVTFNVLPPPHVAEPAVATFMASDTPRLCDVSVAEWQDAQATELHQSWRTQLVTRADAIAAHRVSVFGRDYDLGVDIDWNRDYEHAVRTPLTFAPSIDYRDRRRVGDAKLVWEINRHQHLVVLARAYRATGDRRYAAEAVAQLLSWLDQNPYGRGMNWRSPLELAVRVINWVWTLDLIRDSGCVTEAIARRVIYAAYLHVWDITRKYSQGSSANNHVIGEAAGSFVACSYFDDFPGAAAWRRESFAILNREIVSQTNPDGGTREHATGYHLFVFELLLIPALVGRRFGEEFPAVFWNRLERMLEFAAAFAEHGPLPSIGDADDGYVLDLGRSESVRDALCSGAVLFERGDFKVATEAPEPVRWLLGRHAETRFDTLSPAARLRPSSKALAATGYYLLQAPLGDSSEPLSLIFDCGPLGLPPLAAHGHADALSFMLRVSGRDVFVDPGTFDYFSHPEWRDYFRSTRAHNTVSIDGLDQSVQRGLFLWGRHAAVRCRNWQPDENGGTVEGEHDGYSRLADPVMHRRRITMDASKRLIIIRDELEMQGAHDVALAFHLGEGCDPVQTAANVWEIPVGHLAVRLELDSRLTSHVERGSNSGGWMSRHYHQRTAISSIFARTRVESSLCLECQLVVR